MSTFSTSSHQKRLKTLSIYTFDFEMCFAPQRRVLFRHLNFQKWSENGVFFAPQRRALFRHRNFQKWSGPGVFCTFLLGNVLRATTACNFLSLIWPAGSAPAALASYFSTLRSPKSLEKHSVSRLSYLFAHLHLLSSESFSSTFLSSNLSLLSSLLCFSSVHIVGSLTSKLPSIREACTSYSPVLLCTTKLAQTTSQYYFILQSFHKALPSTILYYNAWTDYFHTSHLHLISTHLIWLFLIFYHVLHKTRSSTTFCTTKLAQTTSQYWCMSTSSTAQGGGGSFKNRKPIGDVDCCESGMAERSHWLTEWWFELCLLEWLQWLQWSPHQQLLDVMWCTATVVVVKA